MHKERIFPRYDLGRLRVQVIFNDMSARKYFLDNASLSGVQIFGENKLITQDHNEVTIKLSENKEFKAFAYQIWLEENVSKDKFHKKEITRGFRKNVYRSGLRLKFLNIEDYTRWLSFIKALHEINLKKSR